MSANWCRNPKFPGTRTRNSGAGRTFCTSIHDIILLLHLALRICKLHWFASVGNLLYASSTEQWWTAVTSATNRPVRPLRLAAHPFVNNRNMPGLTVLLVPCLNSTCLTRASKLSKASSSRTTTRCQGRATYPSCSAFGAAVEEDLVLPPQPGMGAAAGCGTGVDKMSKVFNFSVNATNLKRISNGW